MRLPLDSAIVYKTLNLELLAPKFLLFFVSFIIPKGDLRV
jgi:hypothetical protein